MVTRNDKGLLTEVESRRLAWQVVVLFLEVLVDGPVVLGSPKPDHPGQDVAGENPLVGVVQGPGKVRQKSAGGLGPGLDGLHEGGGDPVDVLLINQLLRLLDGVAGLHGADGTVLAVIALGRQVVGHHLSFVKVGDF